MKTNRIKRGLVFAAALTLSAMFAHADGYLKIGDIRGGASEAGHEDWITVDSVSYGKTRWHRQPSERIMLPKYGGEADSGKLTVKKTVDKSSPKLQEACAKGTHFPKVTLRLRADDDGKAKYLEYRMKDVIVSSVTPSGGAGDVPTEEVTFNFSKIEWGVDESGRKPARLKPAIPATPPAKDAPR